MTGLRAWLSEPLLHFLLLGAALFAAFALWGGSASPGANHIVVTAGTIDSLRESCEQAWGRPPTEDELDALIEDHLREEVLVREALALGLERDDPIIRNRLRQKFEFLFQDLAEPHEPTDDELRAHLEKNATAYRIEPRFTFVHVYLSSARGDTASADAAELLSRLRGRGTDAGSELGDRFLLGHAFEALARGDVERIFGGTFAAALAQVEIGAWDGPIESGHGLHLVRVSARAPGRDPALDEVRNAVRRDWAVARRREANEAMIRELRERYTVTIESADPP